MGIIKLILGASILLFSASFPAQASIDHFKFDFVAASGPSGAGTFSFDNCTGPACPSLDFKVSFGNDPGLIFDTVLDGGAAVSILGLFEGDPSSTSFPGSNFDSQDGLNLLSFESNGAGETSGVYCLRPQVSASGLCAVDPSVFGSGTWSVSPVPATITRQVLIDLDSDGRVIAFPDKDSWEGITSFENYTSQKGDTLKLEIRFANNKALQLSDLPGGVDSELSKLTLFFNSSDFFYDTWVRYEYIGVIGDFNENNLGAVGISSGGSSTNSIKIFFNNDNLTDSSFRYSGIDFYVDFVDFQLNSGSGIIDSLEWSSSADDVQIVSASIPVTIDIKPGSDPNSVNPKSKGVIPVAVLGSTDFDAMQVDPTTVTFGPDGASPKHDGHVEDVNDDGYMDMMFHFKTQETGIVCGDTEATLNGETFEGTSITGTDTVNTVGCKGKSSEKVDDTSSSSAGAVSWMLLVGLGVLGLWRLNRRNISG